MDIILDREVDQIKMGWASRCPSLGLAAHGYSPEVADKNLERLVRRFLAPFEREGVLEREVAALGLETSPGDGDGGVRITLRG